LELSACCSFQLSNYTYEFENYGFVNGENIALFNDQQEIIEKISYYLQHDDERDVIAERAYKHALKCHTWQQRFHAIFECLQKRCGSAAPIRCAPKILVIAGRGIQHQINVEDERLAIRIVDSVSDWQKAALVMDGVIHLDNDSTLNNEALYMMVFGLVADKSDAVVSNFYVGGTNNNDWIRIIDRLAEKNRAVLRMLPASCLMFSGKYAADYGCEWSSNLPQLKVSYVEHPSFWIKLPYYKARKLRLYFAYHVDSRKKFKAYIRNFNFNKAVSLSVDKIWQNTLKKRLGV
jgi:hypothetical protein